MKYVFVTGRVAVTVRYWEERGGEVEGGCRVDVRRVEPRYGESHRPGAAGLSVLPVADGGIWRSDLLVLLGSPRGETRFHHHPTFEHGDVGGRDFEPAMQSDPRGWTLGKLADLPKLLEESGAGDLAASVDRDEWRRALPLVEAAVDACLSRLPSPSGA
ncbi:MAG: DUF7700 domain-containing protein [Actinomycetota bacterium]